VLEKEIKRLIQQGDLDVDVIFVSKDFHVDYGLLEKNLRRVLKRNLPRLPKKPILVYGDLCLGPNGEMKQLAAEYGLVKVDALNCIDCVLGGKGKSEQADPNHELMFFDPGMIEFFHDAKVKMEKEGASEEVLSALFKGLKGIVLLDTLGEAEKCKTDIEKLHTGLAVLETKEVGLGNLKLVLLEAVEQSRKKK
jgi:hypothetical protein